MLDVTYHEFRYLCRLLSRRVVLWTEMVVAETLLHASRPASHLFTAAMESPVICQVGGNDASCLARAVQLVLQATPSFVGVNLNCECPSNKVATRREFGAALMLDVNKTASIVQAMHDAAQDMGEKEIQRIPVSVKTRIAVDSFEDWDFLQSYISALISAGCRQFYIHARKVYTKGLKPVENRTIPPLDYRQVYRLCHAFPHCDFWLNGGIASVQMARDLCCGRATKELAHDGHPCPACNLPYGSCQRILSPEQVPVNLRGCLLGRAVMDHPAVLGNADVLFYGQASNPCQNRRQALDRYCTYLETVLCPRRCCDDETKVTCEYPPPDLAFQAESCSTCRKVYSEAEVQDSRPQHIIHNLSLDGEKPSKITTRLIDRALKPVLGMFHERPGAKGWRRTLDKLSRCPKTRNCGPGFMIRLSMMSCIDPDVLDCSF
jgi:tRNA-dihydrouridine synthase A